MTFPNDIVGPNLVMTTAKIEINAGNNGTINTDIQTGGNATQTGTTEMNDYELDDDYKGTLFMKTYSENIFYIKIYHLGGALLSCSRSKPHRWYNY